MYRPPGPVSKFLSIWTSLLEPLIMAPKAIILGDFNIHFDNTSDLLVAEFIILMVALDWVLKDGMATHRAGHTLDGIFTHPEEELYLSTTPLEWTDHALLTFKFLARQQPIIPIPQKKLIRSWRNIEAEALKITLTHNWNNLKAPTLSPLARFNLGITQAIDSLAPARISVPRVRKKPNQPWFSQALKILQRKYRQKERCWKLSSREAERAINHSQRSALKRPLCGTTQNQAQLLLPDPRCPRNGPQFADRHLAAHVPLISLRGTGASRLVSTRTWFHPVWQPPAKFYVVHAPPDEVSSPQA
ncbi:hypothetical protein NDU88_004850 [Pleurodeles waltl]|uniref:Endonuclease/exonuclease/phosphatase domain-containing protein n=1 Tax=Pleurodeles waltl TaxID=8319 RepID=A0AAV7VHE5_PLEWA|nr:hypothetical protein NDU88_004850 [Pleurodeles waltl]